MHEFGINLPETIRFYDAEIDDDGIMVFDLRTARVPPKVISHPENLKSDLAIGLPKPKTIDIRYHAVTIKKISSSAPIYDYRRT